MRQKNRNNISIFSESDEAASEEKTHGAGAECQGQNIGL